MSPQATSSKNNISVFTLPGLPDSAVSLPPLRSRDIPSGKPAESSPCACRRLWRTVSRLIPRSLLHTRRLFPLRRYSSILTAHLSDSVISLLPLSVLVSPIVPSGHLLLLESGSDGYVTELHVPSLCVNNTKRAPRFEILFVLAAAFFPAIPSQAAASRVSLLHQRLTQKKSTSFRDALFVLAATYFPGPSPAKYLRHDRA